MLTLFMLAMSAPISPDLALTRFEGYMKGHPSFAADFASAGGEHGTIHIARPLNFRIDVKGPRTDYSFIRAGAQGIEIDRKATLYADAFIGPNNIFDFEAQLSGASDDYLPKAFLTGNLRRSLPKDVQATAGANGSIVLQAKLNAPGQTASMNVSVDPQGKLLHYEAHIHNQNQDQDISLNFSNYRDEPHGPYDLKPPMGYYLNNQLLPSNPMSEGQPIHLGNWTDSAGRSQSLDSLVGQGTALIAIVDPEQIPSKRAIAHLGELQTALNGKTKFFALTSSKSSATQISQKRVDAYFGPTAKALFEPGTPLYYLIQNGKVSRAWMGDDDAARAATYREMAEAANAPKKG